METVSASVMWGGSDSDVLTVFVEPTPELWEADPIDELSGFFVLRAVDESGRETGETAGIEIVGFLDFERWQDLPTLPVLWRLWGWEPLPLAEVLQRVQEKLRERVKQSAGAA